jgi:signal transduction histidine kinase
MLGLDTTPAPATSTETRFSIRAQFDAPLPLVEHTLQIMAEGARNVGRHARARMAVITVSPASRKVVIRIDDDGVGFATGATAPWSIASRAAELGGQVRIGGNESGGHVIVELPRG